jgi:acyl dehydratase
MQTNTSLFVGQQATDKKTFSLLELEEFFHLVKSESPCKERPYIPKALIAGMFSALLGTKLPGQGTIYLKQSLNFFADVAIDNELTAKVEILNIRADKGLITCKTLCTDSQNTIICEGEALVMNKEKVS